MGFLVEMVHELFPFESGANGWDSDLLRGEEIFQEREWKSHINRLKSKEIKRSKPRKRFQRFPKQRRLLRPMWWMAAGISAALSAIAAIPAFVWTRDGCADKAGPELASI
jgi:hypothetical protein